MRNFSTKNNKIAISIATAFFVSLVVLFRGPNFDHDYQTYSALYAKVNPRNFHFLSESIEPGYYFLMWLFKAIGASIDSLFFLITFFCLITRFYSVSKFGYLTLAIYIPLYASSFFLIHELNQTRVAISTALFYLITHKLYEFNIKEKIGYRFLYFTPLFHYSSVILFLTLIKKRISTLSIRLLLTVFVSYLAISNLNFDEIIFLFSFLTSNDERAKGYIFEILDFENSSLRIFNGANITYLFYIAVVRLISNIYGIEKNNNRLFKLNELMIILSIILFILFRNSPVVATRLAELLRIFTPLVLAIVISNLLIKGFIPAAVGCILGTITVILNLILYGPAIYPINQYILSPLGLSRVIGA